MVRKIRSRSFPLARVSVRGADVRLGDGDPPVHVDPLLVLDFQAFALYGSVGGMLAGGFWAVSAGSRKD